MAALCVASHDVRPHRLRPAAITCMKKSKRLSSWKRSRASCNGFVTALLGDSEKVVPLLLRLVLCHPIGGNQYLRWRYRLRPRTNRRR